MQVLGALASLFVIIGLLVPSGPSALALFFAAGGCFLVAVVWNISFPERSE